jgi:hypothetical protein
MEKNNINLLITLFLSFLLLSHLIAQEIQKYSAIDSLSINEITLEEMQLYQADYFPLSLAEKGRQSALAWRGMPPGYLDYQFENVALVNPLWGFWDNQLVPIELIRHRNLDNSLLDYNLLYKKFTNRIKPVSRVAFSQDFQFGLSYLDINLARYYNENSYFQLSGNNFLRRGSADGYTNISVNTYRGLIHHQFSPKFIADLWYLQLRHKYRLSSYPLLDEVKRFTRVGQVFWLDLNYTPNSNNTFHIIPYGFKWGDSYHTESYSERSKTEMYSIGNRIKYMKNFFTGSLLFDADVIRHSITESDMLDKKSRIDGNIYLSYVKEWSPLSLRVGGGYYYCEDIGQAPGFNFEWVWRMPFRLTSTLLFVQKPKNMPLSSQFWSGDSIVSLVDPEILLRRGVSWRLGLTPFQNTLIELEPFFYQCLNSWNFDAQNKQFVQPDYENSGIFLNVKAKLWRFWIKNELSYNANYENSFIPEINNILTMNLPLHLFKRALKLNGYVIYHFIEDYRAVGYYPLTNQYTIMEEQSGRFHLLDFKILAHVKSATLFFVWENMASQDYALVENYWEFYRLFRLGIYWTFFD